MEKKSMNIKKLYIKIIAIFMLIIFTFSSTIGALAINNKPKIVPHTDDKQGLLEEFVKTLPRLKEKEKPVIRVIVEVDGDISKVKKSVLNIEGTKIIYEYHQVFNGFSLDIDKKDVDKLFAIDGIKHIDYSDKLIPSMVDAKKLTNVIKAKEEYKKIHKDDAGLDGRGMVIASLDSGVDLYSKDLKLDKGDKDGIDEGVYNSLKIKDTMFTNEDGTPNYKVPYAFNYFRGDSTPEGIMDNVVRPHGMHIAGILAGNSGEKDSGFKGVAPNAQLLVYKVITYDRKTDTRPDLVEYVGEDAAFHAMDDAISRGADIISLSIGNQGSGGSADIWNSAVKKAYEKGVVVVAAMGNWASSNSASSYDSYADAGIDLKDNSSTVSVAANTMAIGVGSTYNTHLQLPSINVDDIELFYQDLSRFNKENIEKIEKKAELPLIYVGSGMEDKYIKDKNFDDIKGKIVVAKRGGEDIKVKATRFLDAGAEGFILVNAVTDYWRSNNDIYPIIGYNHLSIDKAWAIGISGNDGDKLVKYIQSHKGKAKIKFNTEPKSVKLQENTGISGFSSWGPNYDMEIKPDVLATGENINSLGNNGTYTILSGTSMASPHVAGIATLLLQSLKDKSEAFFESLNINKVDFIKALLMNTANVLKDNERDEAKEDVHEYSTRRQGAGVVDAYKALSNNVLITYNKNKGGASLKEIKGNTKEFSVTLHNYGNKTRKFDIKNSGVLHEIEVDRERQNEEGTYTTKTLHMGLLEGAKLDGANEVIIPANSFTELKFTLDVTPAHNEFVEGYIYFISKDDEQPNLNVPFMGFKGSWGDESIFDAPVWEDGSKVNLTGLHSVVYGHEGETEYVEIGKAGNKLLGKEDEELKVDPMQYALNNADRKSGTVIKEVAPRVIFLRNVETYEASIVKEKSETAKPVKVLNVAHHPRKYIYNIYKEGGEFTEPSMLDKWNGRYYDAAKGEESNVEEGQYYYRFKAKVNKKDSKYQTLYLPIKVDNTAPKIKTVLYDKDKNIVKITTEDNTGIWKVSASIDDVTKEVYKVTDNEYVIKDLKLSKLTKNKLVVEAMDFAGNQAVKKEQELSQEEPVVKIANLERVIKNIDKDIKITYPNDLTNILVKDSTGKSIDLNLSDYNNKKEAKFNIGIIKNDYTFTVEWTTSDGVTTKESFVLKLRPISAREKHEEWIVPSSEKFKYDDTSLYPGIFVTYNKIDEDSGDNYIEYEGDGDHIRNMKLHFVLWLKEGQSAVVTNVNNNHNKLAKIDGHKPMDTYEVSEEDGVDGNEHSIGVDSGVNTINLKVYEKNQETGKKDLVYNRGFFVYIDTNRPTLKLDNTNIVYNTNYDVEDTDELAGNIYTKDGRVKLSGEFGDDLDGVSLRINDNVIDSVHLAGENGYNNKKFDTEVAVNDGDILKVEVKDNSENSRKLKFRVIKDDKLPVVTITPSDVGGINKDTVLNVNVEEKFDINYDTDLIEKHIFVNGKEYVDGDALRKYAINDEDKFNIVVIVSDKAGNKVEKNIKVNVDSSLEENLKLKKDEFTIEELNDVNNLIELRDGVKADIISADIDDDTHTAMLTLKVSDKYSFNKTYILPVKLVEKHYARDEQITLKLKKKEFHQGEKLDLSTLFDLPEDMGIIVLNKIDATTQGEKNLRLKLFKGDKYNIVDYKINVLPELKNIIYDSDGGSKCEKENHNKGSIIKLNKTPKKDGYTFKGWYLDGKRTYKVETIELLDDVTVYAKWEKNKGYIIGIDSEPQSGYDRKVDISKKSDNNIKNDTISENKSQSIDIIGSGSDVSNNRNNVRFISEYGNQSVKKEKEKVVLRAKDSTISAKNEAAGIIEKNNIKNENVNKNSNVKAEDTTNYWLVYGGIIFAVVIVLCIYKKIRSNN